MQPKTESSIRTIPILTRARASFMAIQRYGDLVFLMPVGHQIAPSFMGITAPIAMHGYTPDDPVMDACFVTTGIGPDAISILDVAPTLWRAVEDATA